MQNETNRKKNRQAGLDRSIRVIHGSFDDIPEPDSGYDVVWSQDAILLRARPPKGARGGIPGVAARRRTDLHRSDAGRRCSRRCAAAGLRPAQPA
ncbi:Putative methyltransferase (part1) [Mycobacterium canettii CIPT 140070008]|nr:Putative methyltransferase (part1) [Mycobacterium canettii CIPT 140070008]